MLRPDKWGAGLGVGAGLGRQSLLFLIPHLCLPHKLSRALPQRPSQSPPNKPLWRPSSSWSPPLLQQLVKGPGQGLAFLPQGTVDQAWEVSQQ